MSQTRRHLLNYLVAVAAVGAAILLRWSVDPLVEQRIPFATILAAIAVAVGVGGLYPALLAMVLGYVGSSILFAEPRGVLRLATAADWITLAGFLFASFTVIGFGLLMRRAQRRERAIARALQELNDRKDNFLVTVAHELRNPLVPIRNAAELLRRESESRPEWGVARDMIDRQVDHLSRLIDDLIAMDRIARNELELRHERVSLTAAVEHCTRATRSLMDGRGQVLEVALSQHPLWLDGDVTRLEQVVTNLLANAVKFTPDGGRIHVMLDQADGNAVLSIKDTGIGVTREALPRLFEMFYQADPMQRGLGIGLALVRHLVELHGGSVSVRSEGLSRGSEFIVSIPLAANQGLPEGAVSGAMPLESAEDLRPATL